MDHEHLAPWVMMFLYISSARYLNSSYFPKRKMKAVEIQP